MKSYPLRPSPIAQIRRALGLSRREAAKRLGMPPRHLAVLEMRSHEIPRPVRDMLRHRLTPSKHVQTTIWDAIAALEEEGGVGHA